MEKKRTNVFDRIHIRLFLVAVRSATKLTWMVSLMSCRLPVGVELLVFDVDAFRARDVIDDF